MDPGSAGRAEVPARRRRRRPCPARSVPQRAPDRATSVAQKRLPPLRPRRGRRPALPDDGVRGRRGIWRRCSASPALSQGFWSRLQLSWDMSNLAATDFPRLRLDRVDPTAERDQNRDGRANAATHDVGVMMTCTTGCYGAGPRGWTFRFTAFVVLRASSAPPSMDLRATDALGNGRATPFSPPDMFDPKSCANRV